MLYQDLIRRKRMGETLTTSQINALVRAITDGSLNDAQLGAFAMAVLWRGMTRQECVALTLEMRDSGEVLDWAEARGPVVDKHSTGGVGDTTSLILAPALAACGALVPMLSGRALGHTGGTLDKLEAIPGYRTNLDTARLRDVLDLCGCAIVGASDALAPADRRFYAIRDMTATVESLDLIVASILSKKLAAGIGSLVLDVKCGTGAFMATRAQAEALARALVEVAAGAGCPARAQVTDMNQPLAPAVGNALEVLAALDVLRGGAKDGRLYQLCCSLGGELLVLAGLAPDSAAGRAQIARAIATGAAAERFGKMVAALGGPSDLLERPGDHLARAPVNVAITATGSGYVQRYDGRALGLAAKALGAGRRSASDRTDPRVGFSEIAEIGTLISPGDLLARIHAADEIGAHHAAQEFRAALVMGADQVAVPTLILGQFGG